MTTTLTSIPPVAALKPRKSLVDLRKEFSDFLDEELIGQPKVKKLALRIFSQIYNPMRDPNKPIFSAILAGESRTGKTLLVKLFAKWFHGREDAMVRIDGGEFLDKHYISRAIGAPPSYVGYKNPNDDDPKNALKPEDKDPSALLSQHNLNRGPSWDPNTTSSSSCWTSSRSSRRKSFPSSSKDWTMVRPCSPTTARSI